MEQVIKAECSYDNPICPKLEPLSKKIKKERNYDNKVKKEDPEIVILNENLKKSVIKKERKHKIKMENVLESSLIVISSDEELKKSKNRKRKIQKDDSCDEKIKKKKIKQEKGKKVSNRIKKKKSIDKSTLIAHTDVNKPNIKPIKTIINYEVDSKKCWTDTQWVAKVNSLNLKISENLIYLFKSENSIPFIARYRRDMIDGLSTEQLLSVKQSYDTLLSIRKKAAAMINHIQSENKLTDSLKYSILNAQSLDELEHIYAPFKRGAKTLLSERAKSLGLEDVSLSILNGLEKLNIDEVSQSKRLSLKQIGEGIVNIISYIISHDSESLSFIHDLVQTLDNHIFIETKQMNRKSKIDENSNKKSDIHKFEIYFDFKIKLAYIKPHQVLAINRGQSKKILSVKVILPNQMFLRFKDFCFSKWYEHGHKYHLRINIFEDSVQDAYKRFITPLITRKVMGNLKDQAKKAAVEVFSSNLKNKLLINPCKGKKILGIDPGFKMGSKLALISETGEILASGIIYPFSASSDKDALFLKNMLEDNNCYTIALGNGTASREIEEWLTKLNEKNFFKQSIHYSVVDESGVSIYSCSSEAKQEFGDLDPFVISAASLARRLQDPLSELVKVEPKHLGVGMYQHDLKDTVLNESLNEVVSECVSFVGVNLNTASTFLLQKVAGLNEKRALSIIEHRQKIKFFSHRLELKNVSGIGDKTFEQCAGFLRVGLCSDSADEKSFYKISQTTPLDRTWIHPESYEVAKRFINMCKVDIYELGKDSFIKKIQHFLSDKNICSLTENLNVTKNVLQLIIDALLKPLDYDMRLENSQKALFLKGIMYMSDLKIGSVVTGRVQNVTHFGSFIDIGVERAGLIHVSRLNNISLRLGDRVEVEVINCDIEKGHIHLKLITVLNEGH